MAQVVIGTFESQEQAEKAADELQQAGSSKEDISLISKDNQGGSQDQGSQMNADVSEGVGWGAGLGSGAGLLASAGALAIPGIGPLLAVGPLAATLSGAVVGGLAG